MKNRRQPITASLLILLTSASLAQSPEARPGWNDTQQRPPATPQITQDRSGILTLHTGVQLVLQDITVTDAAGHPVTGLKPEDFHISEDGHPQSINSFEEHAPVDPALAEQRAAELAHTLPPNTFTNYKAFSGGTLVVFLIDSVDQVGCGLGATTLMHLRQDMIDYMNSMPLGTPYIIVQLDTRLHMLQDMTTDRGALQQAVYGKRDFPELPPQLSPDDPRFPKYVAAQRRREILTAAMTDLRQYLGAIPGKKNLIWFLGELGPSLVMMSPTTTPTTDNVTYDPSTHDLVYADRNQIELMPADRLGGELKTNPSFAAFMGNLTGRLEQNRIALSIMQGHPIPGTDPTICDYPNGKERIAAIVDHGAHFYTVSYSPTAQNWSGHPHTFSVQLSDPTLHLDYRRAYLASPGDTAVQHNQSPIETASAAALLHDATGPSPTLQTAMGMGTVEPTQIVFQASAMPSPAETKDPGKAPPAPGNFLNVKLRKQGYRDYTVHFSVRADELKLTPSGDDASYTAQLDLVAVVYDNQGQAVNGKREHTSLRFPDLTDPSLRTSSLTGDLTIQVPAKGNYFLRLGVRDAATDRVGALEIPVDRIPITKK